MNQHQDERFIQLRTWLQSQLATSDFSIEPASEDASFRRYFRVTHDDKTLIAMDAPPDKEDSHPFVRIAGYLTAMHVHGPQVLAENFAEGFFLLTDLGQTQYLAVLNAENVSQLYADAMQALLQMQRVGVAYVDALPPYDHRLLLNEMNLFRDWYLCKHLRLELTTAQTTILDTVFAFLAEQALQQPVVFVHRDYHSRNLMFIDQTGQNPGVLDFQDAVAGPLTYDLVSLLRDCYIEWPRAQVMHWVEEYHRALHGAGLFREISLPQFVRWFDLMGIQRHLKASGIFARLNHRDGKPGYLNDIPRTVGYILQIAPGYAELDDFLGLLQELSIPSRLQQVPA